MGRQVREVDTVLLDGEIEVWIIVVVSDNVVVFSRLKERGIRPMVIDLGDEVVFKHLANQ